MLERSGKHERTRVWMDTRVPRIPSTQVIVKSAQGPVRNDVFNLACENTAL